MSLLSYEQIRQIQLELNGLWDDKTVQALGCEADGTPLAIDGVIGPKTMKGVFLHPGKVSTPIAKVALQELFAGSQEAPGKNNAGEFVAKYYRVAEEDYDGKNLGAWCAAFASWCLREAYGPGTPYIVGARRLTDALPRVAPELISSDDLISWKRDSKRKYTGHVGIVAHVDSKKIVTIEGNVGKRGRVRAFMYFKDDMFNRGATGPLWKIGRWQTGDVG